MPEPVGRDQEPAADADVDDGVVGESLADRERDAAVNVLRGLLLGLFSFAAFFVLLALGLNRIGIGLSFVLATATALVIQGLTLRAIRGAGDSGLP